MKKLILFFIPVIFFCVPVFADEFVYMPWSFEIYEEAAFDSRVVGRSESRIVTVTENGENHWAYVDAGSARGWVNMRNTPAISELDNYFTPMGRDISVFYMNIETGYTYIHNPDRVYFAASLSKSNYALYAYTLAERGIIDINAVHTYTLDDYWGGTGIMRFMDYGRQFTTRDLLGLAIRESDNAAYRMLIRLFQNTSYSYRDFVTEIGAETDFIRNTIAQNTSPRDAGLFMRSIYNYIESGSRFGHFLKDDMLNTAQTSHQYFSRWEGSNGVGGEVNIRMIQSDYPFARKYGWAPNAFHEAGIVYAPSPYIIVILSNMDRGANELFEEIGWFIQDINHRFFVSPTTLNGPKQGPEIYSGQHAAMAAQRSFRVTAPVFAEDMI